ncbi:amidase signature enzyme [Rhizodiscina lignyota]|uniref:amidase n=1 Tax=Rhizodiscina lignyota TaxID=1504668 RepID=A0A9P4I8M3_9PEZI|nr:amidase signature enzyme [Rhizodiscina lignyota]
MLYPFDYFQHRRDCARKQSERASKIATLPKPYLNPLAQDERSILQRPIAELVQDVHKNITSPVDILRTYGKVAIKAQEKTNCLTEIMFPEAESWIEQGDINLKGPLAGIPVSLKDSIKVGGFVTSVGYSRYSNRKAEKDGAMVRLLKDAGAVPFVKTNLPITLLSFESTNDLWGRTSNPHNAAYSPGGSTGGEAALLAFGGSRIGIGSDVAGSVRAPAHFSGCYSIRCSTGRWPKAGVETSMLGQEAIASVFSPMARTMGDLTYFTRSIIGMKPWKYDHTVHPIEWRDSMVDEYATKSKLRVGILRTDGVVDPAPACARALQMVADALQGGGHDVFDVVPPGSPASCYDALVVASQGLNADGCRTFRSHFRTGETDDPGAREMRRLMSWPAPFRYLYYLWYKYVWRDPIWAGLVRDWSGKSSFEQWKIVAKREGIKARWHEWWENETGAEKMDILLTVPNATPAVPAGGMKEAVSSCGYTFLFNLLDYPCGIIPVTHVDPAKDALSSTFNIRKLNGVARGAYVHYDAQKMAGLPVAIQVVGQRLEEEKVLAVMERIETLLEERGEKYQLLEVD